MTKTDALFYAKDKIRVNSVHPGFIWTPNTAAVAPLLTESKTPLIIMNAATSVLTRLSPYVVRASMTLWQPAYHLGIWASKKYKRVYTMVMDMAPGHDAEQAFIKGFTEGGGQIIGSVRMPLKGPDFIAFMQRAKDVKPDAIFNWVTAGTTSTAIMKAYNDLNVRQAGIPFIGTGDAVTEEELANQGGVSLGYISAWHYSMAGDRPAMKAFVAAWERDYGRATPPGSWRALSSPRRRTGSCSARGRPPRAARAARGRSCRRAPRDCR